jgi:hypothetical protein
VHPLARFVTEETAALLFPSPARTDLQNYLLAARRSRTWQRRESVCQLCRLSADFRSRGTKGGRYGAVAPAVAKKVENQASTALLDGILRASVQESSINGEIVGVGEVGSYS